MQQFLCAVILSLCVCMTAAEGRFEPPELSEEPGMNLSGTPHASKTKSVPESRLDKILSGQESVPVFTGEEVEARVDSKWTRLKGWIRQETKALISLLIATVSAVVLGGALAFVIRRYTLPRKNGKSGSRMLALSLLAGPLLLMVVSSVIFVFLLPILHSVPWLYPLDARLFFSWMTLLAAWGGFQLIVVFDGKLHAVASRPENNLDALLVDITRKLLKIALIVVTVFFIGQTIFQFNLTTLLAGAGVVGLAVAFASRETLSNFFGTLVIILDRPFRCGDRIQAGDVNGIVEAVGMRSTRIRTGTESVFSIPNSRIAELPVENISSKGVIRYTFTLGLVYGTAPEEIQKAIKLVHAVADDFKGSDRPQYRPRVFFDELGASALNVRVIVWFKAIAFDEEEVLRSEFNLAIIRAFTENNLNLAYTTQSNNLSGTIRLLGMESGTGGLPRSENH